MLTLHKTLTHVEPKLFVGSFVVCAIGSCAYLAKNSGMGELDISGKKVCRVHPRPPWTATSYSLISHICGQAPTLSELPLHLLTQVPLVRYADWGISIPLMLYQLCDLGGAAAMLKVPAVVLVPRWCYTQRAHTHRGPLGREACASLLWPALHTHGQGRGTGSCLQSALFQGLCSGTARRQAAPRSSHAVTPPPHTAHTLLFHNIKARTPPAPCS